VSARNAGLEEQGEGVLVVGIRSEAARGGGVFLPSISTFELLVGCLIGGVLMASVLWL